MAQIIPPSYANLKRKRSTPIFSSPSSSRPSHLPPDSINPHNYDPSTLKQLSVAGLSDSDKLPSVFIRHFPHRPLPSSQDPELGPDSASEAEDEGKEGKGKDDPQAAAERKEQRRKKGLQHAARAHERHLGVLDALIHRSIEAGDIPRAKRAFGLLLRAEVYGKPVDLRENQYWALGAEILMRDGETKKPSANPYVHTEQQGGLDGEEEDGGEISVRWGSAANILKVRRYYEDLIQLYPYNRLWPRATSALTFWPVMVGVELYNIWVEERLALQRIEAEAEEWDDSMAEEGSDGPELSKDGQGDGWRKRGLRRGSREARLREEKENIRLEMLDGVRDIARRMDAVMETPPYSKNHEMLRLRGMVALYMGDLAMPCSPRTPGEDYEGRRKRKEERERAKGKFRKIIKDDGEVEEYIAQLVYPERAEEDEDEDMDEDMTRPMFSSLAIRERSS